MNILDWKDLNQITEKSFKEDHRKIVWLYLIISTEMEFTGTTSPATMSNHLFVSTVNLSCNISDILIKEFDFNLLQFRLHLIYVRRSIKHKCQSTFNNSFVRTAMIYINNSKKYIYYVCEHIKKKFILLIKQFYKIKYLIFLWTRVHQFLIDEPFKSSAETQNY